MRTTDEIFNHRFSETEFDTMRKTKQPCVAAAVARLTGSFELETIGTGFSNETRNAGYAALAQNNIYIKPVHTIESDCVYWVEYALNHVVIVDTRNNDFNAIGITKRYNKEQLSQTVSKIYELTEQQPAQTAPVCETLNAEEHCLTLSKQLIALQRKTVLFGFTGFFVGAITTFMIL